MVAVQAIGSLVRPDCRRVGSFLDRQRSQAVCTALWWGGPHVRRELIDPTSTNTPKRLTQRPLYDTCGCAPSSRAAGRNRVAGRQ
jgi:hypothetical protein